MKLSFIIYFVLLLLFIPQLIIAQVGIGTTNPQETLHVVGSLRVENTTTNTATKIMGTDGNGTLNGVNVGANLQLAGGTLEATGSNKYFVNTETFITSSAGHRFHNVDLDLIGANQDIVVFRLSGMTHNFEFTGITGGTDGKHIILLNVTANNFKLTDESTGSLAANRIITLAGGFEATSGIGVAELVYDGTINRWIIINFRN